MTFCEYCGEYNDELTEYCIDGIETKKLCNICAETHIECGYKLEKI